jgi:predicted DNA-binding transcriptional regulator YafY
MGSDTQGENTMEDQALSKAARLQKIVHLLYRNPNGLTTAELSRHCGVTVRTIQRDLKELERAGVPVWEGEDGCYGVTEGYYLPPIHFNLEEAGVLYLAARLLAGYSDEHNRDIVHALAKLSGAMPDTIAAHIHHTIRSLSYRRENRTFAEVLRTMILAWATGRKVRIWHRSAGSENVHEYLFCPYFLEPSSAGYATYAIGHSSYFDDIHTFKLERIQAVQLTEDTFEIPEDFDGAQLLQNAWGIMYGPAGEESPVVLRFSPAVSRRVQESVWHPSQQVEAKDDGGCILRVWVARPMEMKPFIRSWGPECEVLAPAWLRREVIEEMRRVTQLYAES